MEKKWVPRNEWKTEMGRKEEWGNALAQEARAQTTVPKPPPRPGPSPGHCAADAPSCDPGVPPKGTTWEAQAPNGPTERGLASANIDGLKPPLGNKLTKGQNGVMSDQEGGGHHHSQSIQIRHHLYMTYKRHKDIRMECFVQRRKCGMRS